MDALAYQAVKYRQRDGVTHRDLLRLAHPAGKVSAGNPSLEVSPEHEALFKWIVRGTARMVCRAWSRGSSRPRRPARRSGQRRS